MVAAYAGTLSGPFVLDDRGSVLNNRTIRSFWPPPGPLAPPGHGHGLMSRPVANVSLALSYAISGPEPRGYRLGNALLHLASAGLLYGWVRRTLRRAPASLRSAATGIALASALLWAVHPLCTDVVLYAAQRTDACLGFFYLLTGYAAARCFERRERGAPARGWTAVAVLASALGMASKELMATAPLLLLLYDRAFWSGTVRQALSRHRVLHVSLFATLAIFAALQFPDPRGRAAYFWNPHYLLAQTEVVLHYLWLVVWPQHLVFDYGPLVPGQTRPGAAALLLAGSVGASAVLALRMPRLGFAGVFVFGLLAPTSSLIAMPPEVGAERRMYLALAGVLAYGCAGVHAGIASTAARAGLRPSGRSAAPLGLLALVAVGLTARTRLRARDWQSERALWESTVAARPMNPRAHLTLGNLHQQAGELEEAARAYRRSLRITESLDAHNNLGGVLAQLGELEAGLRHMERATEIDPRDVEARANLELLRGVVNGRRGRPAEPTSPQ